MARKFTFRLDPLLRLRRHEEEARKRALAQTLAKVNEQTARAGRYEGLVRSEHARLRQGGLVGELDVRRLAHHRRYVNTLMRAMVETLSERAASLRQSHQARAELAEALKRRKVLDNLRDRRLTQWRLAADRVEAKELDELGLRAHSRRTDPSNGATR